MIDLGRAGTWKVDVAIAEVAMQRNRAIRKVDFMCFC